MQPSGEDLVAGVSGTTTPSHESAITEIMNNRFGMIQGIGVLVLFALLGAFPARVASSIFESCELARRVNFELGKSYWSPELLNDRRREQLLIPGVTLDVISEYEKIHNSKIRTYCPDVW